MTKLSEIRLTKFGWFFTIGCSFLVLLLLSPLLLWGLSEIDDAWETKWTSFSFEKETYWIDNVFGGYMGVEKIAIENENTFTLFGASDSVSRDKRHPIAMRTTDGGKNWKLSREPINFRYAQFFHRGDSVFMVRYLETRYRGEHQVYVSTGDYMNWEYFGKTVYSGLGYARVKQEYSSFETKSFLLEKENTATWSYGDLCSSLGKKYAQSDKNWIICGYDRPDSSIHEVHILHKYKGEYKIHSSFPNKWHIFTAVGMNPSDFYVEDSLFVGLLDFKMGNAGLRWLHYLYYSTDGGKSWHNRKLPRFSEERLLVTEDKILILGLDEYSQRGRIFVSILTMPKPKR